MAALLFTHDAFRQTNALSRTSSASSVSSVSSSETHQGDEASRDGDTPRRTRKRFTSAQLMALEHLYHQTSHPTREQREALSREAGIELRSVTVWFQNKRQTERKIALHSGPNDTTSSSGPTPFPTIGAVTRPRRMSSASSASPPLSASPSMSSISSSSARTVRTHALAHVNAHAHRPQLGSHRRPSLDHIASRAERPTHILRTPTRLRTQSSPDHPDFLYDNMPSSPLDPDAEAEREFVDFARRSKSKTARPTLEWACAAARMSGRHVLEDDGDIEEMVLDACGDTEDEADVHEAVTPGSSASGESRIWRSRGSKDVGSSPDRLATPKAKLPSRLKEQIEPKVAVSDEDVMDAALALCGLGGNFSTNKSK